MPDDTFLTNMIRADYSETVSGAESSLVISDTIYVVHPILDLEKVCTEMITEGGDILYEIILINNWHIDAEGVEVTDYIPEGVFYTPGNASATSGSFIVDNSTHLVWSGIIGNVTGVNTVNITIHVTDDPAFLNDTITNRVEYTSIPSESYIIRPFDTCITTVIHPDISLTMEVDADKAVSGTNVTYTYNATNIGDTTLFNVEIWDDAFGVMIASVAELAPGDSLVDTYMIALTEETTNIANVTAFDQLENTVEDEATATVDVINPDISLTMEVDADKAVSGTNVTYTYNATNIGDTTLFNVEIWDDAFGVMIASVAELAPGDSLVDTYMIALTEETTNIANVTAFDQLENTVEDEATATVDVINPAISVIKTCEATEAFEPGTIEWNVTVMNTGDVDLDVTVTDSQHGIIFEGIIAAGDSEAIIITDTDLTAGTYVNEVTAEGIHQLGTVNDTDVATCEIQVEF